MSSNPTASAASRGSASGRRLSAGPDRKSDVRTYDFRRPTKLSRDHVRTLQIAFETFTRQYTTLLTSTLRVVGQVQLISIEQLTYDEYVGMLSSPTVMAIVALDPLPGKAILEFSQATGMATVDHMLGGPGGSQPTRPLTEIEAALIRGFIERVLRELAYSLTSLAVVKPRLEKLEHNPQFAQTAVASDTVVVASFEMAVGREQCIATLCIPFAALFPLLEAANANEPTERERTLRAAATRTLRRSMEGVPVEIGVRFTPTTVPSRDMINLQVGDVLRLRHPAVAPLDVTVADVTFAHAVPGNRGKRLACLVVDARHEEKTV